MPNAGPTVHTVALLQVFRETTFGTDITGSLASFLAVPFQEGTGTFTIPQETHDPMHAVQYHHDYREEILGKKLCTLQFTMPLAPTGVAADDSTAAVQSTLGYILESVLGGESPNPLDMGSTALALWGAPDSGDVQSTDGDHWDEGGCIGWVNSAGEYEMRPVQTIATDTITTKLEFSAAPAMSDVLYNAVSYYPTSDPSDSLQFAARGLESEDEWVLMGMQLDSLSLTLPIDGTIPAIQLSFKGVTWLKAADSTGSASFTDIVPVAYTNTSPITGQSGRFMHQLTGTATFTGSTVPVSAVTIEPQHTFQPITSPSGIEGVLRWRLSRQNGPSIQGSFQTFFEDTTWWTHKESKDDLLLLYQIGTTAGQSVMIEVATAQFTDVQRVDGSGIADLVVTWKGRRDQDQGVGTGDAGLRPYAIHFG